MVNDKIVEYEYGNIDTIKSGDVVQIYLPYPRSESLKGKLALVRAVEGSQAYIELNNTRKVGYLRYRLEAVRAIKPEDAQVGDKVFIKESKDGLICDNGFTYTISETSYNGEMKIKLQEIRLSPWYDANNSNFVIIRPKYKTVNNEEGKFLYFKWTYASYLGGFHIAKVPAYDLKVGKIIYVDSQSKAVSRKIVGDSVHAGGSFTDIIVGRYNKVPSKDFGAWEKVTESYVNELLSKPSNIAFYKRSGLPWTHQELKTIALKYGTEMPKIKKSSEVYLRKYVFQSSQWQSFEPWYPQKVSNHIKVAYEDAFNDSPVEEVCDIALNGVDSKISDNQIQYEGNQMKKQEVNVEVRVNGEIVAGNGEKTHKKVFNSDLEMVQTVKRGKHIVVWYDHTGREVSMSYGTVKEAHKELQNPEKLGWTYRAYKISESATTEIPTKSLEV